MTVVDDESPFVATRDPRAIASGAPTKTASKK